MKALTICQPYAWLILAGEKAAENRTWPTAHRGALAIHAGMDRSWLGQHDEDEARKAGHPLVFGAVVGQCVLADCLRIEEIVAGQHEERYPQLKNHVHCHGPWCWVLTDVTCYATPLPWRGKQGLWTISDGCLPTLPCTLAGSR